MGTELSIRKEPVEVRIKAGTRDGQLSVLPVKGNAGLNGGPSGDLYLIVRVGTTKRSMYPGIVKKQASD